LEIIPQMRDGRINSTDGSDAALVRAQELDALDAILPLNRREKLAELLTDDDVATLKHLAKQGLGANTMRALASDLAYLEAWSLASTGKPLPWPAPEALLIKFVAQHLWDAHERELDANHGMPDAVSASLRENGQLRTTIALRLTMKTGAGDRAPPPVFMVNLNAMARA
jgi:hypothetical protein